MAERKPLNELLANLDGASRVLIVGCGTCVTVCMAGGEKEAAILASQLRLARSRQGRPVETREVTVERQCEAEFVAALDKELGESGGSRESDAPGFDAVVSLGCGVGVQAIAERFPTVRVLPGLNTKFLGMPVEQGVWVERCGACGNCVLDKTAGICPVARCSKSLLNGPCGGSQGGKCEIRSKVDCAWALIHDRLAAQGRLDVLDEVLPPRDWSTARDGGPRKVTREDMAV